MNKIEKLIVDTLLAGNHPVLNNLRKQVEALHVKSRDFTGYGFYVNFSLPSDIDLIYHGKDFDIGDVWAESNGNVLGFILFIKSGKISLLECFSIDEMWDIPDELDIFYTKLHGSQALRSQSRDMVSLVEKLNRVGF